MKITLKKRKHAISLFRRSAGFLTGLTYSRTPWRVLSYACRKPIRKLALPYVHLAG